MAQQASSIQLLRRTYTALRLDEGRLLSPARRPVSGQDAEDWESVGDWLSLAERMGADRLFFVDDDPVLVFSAMPDNATEANFVRAYRQAWSLSRPRCLFLSTQDELRVYALSAPPPDSLEGWNQLTPLQIVERTADIADVLRDFSRDQVESGVVFESDQFVSAQEGQANRQLVTDIHNAASYLTTSGLQAEVAHSLIERAILIRYLEDREVITADYIDQIATSRTAWRAAVESTVGPPVLGAQSRFIRCLGDKGLTYAVFAALEHEFNGDLFVVSEEEHQLVSRHHLHLLQELLTGSVSAAQQPLFLWAYDFSVIPTSVISSMYELFYHLGGTEADGNSTHYTPPELVEYVTARIMTPEVLRSNPRVCDPACGSGVFLVEAYKAIVRHEMAMRRRALSPGRLRELLMQRIAGIDVNREAVRLAAFSLYLALLNYQTPRDIRMAGPLPRLIHVDGTATSGILVVADAFSPTRTESADRLFETSANGTHTLPWRDHEFDVVLGNPPWDEPRGRSSSRTAERWAVSKGLSVGDRSPSQLFMWRSLSLVKPTGIVGLLVVATVLHNTRSTSRAFRNRWLKLAVIREVTDFSQARRLFFAQGIAPFCFIKYQPAVDSNPPSGITYGTLWPTPAFISTHSLSYGRLERRLVAQSALQDREYLWKVYSWGSHLDEALMSRLDIEDTVEKVVAGSAVEPGYGYQYGSGRPSGTLLNTPSLDKFEPWGPLQPTWFEPHPVGVKRQPDERLYSGVRLLIRRGIRTGFGPRIRLVEEPLTFRHHTYCIPLDGIERWQADLLYGILLSSLIRYRLFMTSGSWGLWHDSIVSDDILSAPVRIPEKPDRISRRILEIVAAIRSWTSSTTIPGHGGVRRTNVRSAIPIEHLANLNHAVFDLFELTVGERDIVQDWERYRLPLIGSSTSARERAPMVARPGTGPTEYLSRYVDTFVRCWDSELAPDGTLTSSVTSDPSLQILAAVFETVAAGEVGGGEHDLTLKTSDSAWSNSLGRLAESLRGQLARKIVVDGVVRAVTDTSIVIIKRNDVRLWSATAAREDFDATLVQAMNLGSL